MEKRTVKYARNIYGEEEKQALINFANNETTITGGEYINQFEKEFAEYLGINYCLTVNSGSSANYLAFMSLTSDQLGDRRIKKGDEVITVACGFPTTISPIVNYGAVPVFVDVSTITYNINTKLLEQAVNEKTKAVILAHTLGNPFDIYTVKEFCNKYNLFLVEDNCDSLGSYYDSKYTGTFGDVGTSSFFPAHHMTCGEGGAVYTNNEELYLIMKSFRDWGRDYRCVDCDRYCENRFENGYDCRYTYSHFGYNLKITEMQAVLLLEQLKKLSDFNTARKNNWTKLRNKFENFINYFSYQYPEIKSNPAWFSFLMTIRENVKINRNDLMQYLEEQGIETRTLFAGNIINHTCMKSLQEGIDYRIIGNLINTDFIMGNSFFVGCYPKITDDDIEYIYENVKNFIFKS